MRRTSVETCPPDREASDRGFVEFASAGESRAGETWLPSERRSNGVRGARTVRLGFGNFYPAAGQGASGLEVRVNDLEIKKIVTSVSHAQTWFCTAVEREFLRLLGGGCQLPLALQELAAQHVDLQAFV
jgi:porphobilinogen deaminase-like protein